MSSSDLVAYRLDLDADGCERALVEAVAVIVDQPPTQAAGGLDHRGVAAGEVGSARHVEHQRNAVGPLSHGKALVPEAGFRGLQDMQGDLHVDIGADPVQRLRRGERLAPCAATSVSSCVRNSTRSPSLTTPLRLTIWSAACADLPPPSVRVARREKRRCSAGQSGRMAPAEVPCTSTT